MSLVKEQFLANKESWKNSSLNGLSEDANGNPIPWMSYPAIEYLEKNLNSNHDIFEFGLGSSSLFFAKRVKSVMSLETNPKWLKIIKSKVFTNNIEVILMENGLIDDNYQKVAKNCGKKFDFIIIDSIKRFQCAQNSIEALKEGGKIILDDSERDHYYKIFNFFKEKGFQKQDFIGIAPGQVRVKNTTVFYK